MTWKSSNEVRSDAPAEDAPKEQESALTGTPARSAQGPSSLTVNAGMTAGSRLATMHAFEMRAFLMLL